MASSSGSFVKNDSYEQINSYVNEICSQHSQFLCDNRSLCATSPLYGSVENIDKICSDMKQANECENDFKECTVSTQNLFDDAHGSITTSFVNIILPIKDAFDDAGNQKFLRLPALSGKRNEKSQDICNICTCMNRFSTSPGAGAVLNEKSNTSPGQNVCIYPDFIEHYYYPLSIENVTTKLKETPPIKLGKYNILNSNIIYAHSEQELLVENLYDLLIKNGIPDRITKDFIIGTLYQNSSDKSKQLDLYLNGKREQKRDLVNKGFFYENITFFYILLVLFLIFIILM